MSEGRTYTCAFCGETFESDWTEEEATEEHRQLFGKEPGPQTLIACDDCFKEGIRQMMAGETMQ